MKRTLLLANACFSDTGSNGRTLKNLFNGAEADKLAQLFVYGEPDFSFCSSYYQVTDGEVLRSLITLKQAGGPVKEEEQQEKQQGKAAVGDFKTTIKKAPWKVLTREIVWFLGKWKNKQLWQWIEDFDPEIIVLYIANNTYLIRLARLIAKRYTIPIFIYSTEGYSFMHFNYITNHPSITYELYYSWLCREYKRISPYVSEGFLNNTLLRDRYEEEYGYSCHCIMNSSLIAYENKAKMIKREDANISYLGNLGLSRYKALIEIAKALQEIDREMFLNVYGEAPNTEVTSALKQCEGIKYHGLISYEKVIDVIHSSSLLVHAEYNNTIINRDLQYAFSTKIADCLCSGTPFLIYADENLAETKFLMENDCAFIVNDRNSLKETLELALTNQAMREEKLEKARIVRERFLIGNREFMKALE